MENCADVDALGSSHRWRGLYEPEVHASRPLVSRGSGSLSALILVVLVLGALSGGCGGKQVSFEIEDAAVQTLQDEVALMQERLAASLEQTDAFVEEIGALPPQVDFDFAELAQVRFVLEGCFVASLEQVSPGAAGYSMMLAADADPGARTGTVDVEVAEGPRPLTERSFVASYLPCYLDEMRALEAQMASWSVYEREWMARTVAVVDGLRVSLKALVPELSAQSRLDLARVEGQLQQLMTEAEDTLDRSRRDDVRVDTRRRIEQRFEEIDAQLRALQEAVDRTREQLDELTRRERSYVRRVAVALARLGM